MKTNVSKSKSMQATLKQLMSRKKLTDDELWKIENDFHSCFGKMSNVQRVAILKRFWESGYATYAVDMSTNCVYSSSSLVRAFTISHDHLIRQHKIEFGEQLNSPEKLATAVEELKRSIVSQIKKRRGVVTSDDGPELEYPAKDSPTFFFSGFQPGLASDDYLIGMFFSEVDREQAILDIIERWGSWGVRTEPLAEERTVHSMRGWFWEKHFDRKQFRRKFQKLSHEDRLNAIEELNAKGIDFKFTDRTSDECYQSHWRNYGAVRNSRCFSYDFDLGYLPEDRNPFDLPENFPSAEERRKEIDEVERTLLHLIAKHGGFVTRIERNVDDEAVSLEESENFLGSGHIHARFPDNQSRREASREIHERLAVASVSFPVEDGEELSIDEQIAVAHDELAEKRKELDYASSNLDYRKQRHREEGPAIEGAEQRLREEEIEFKELEKKIAERVKALSLCREGLSELETQGEERMDDV